MYKFSSGFMIYDYPSDDINTTMSIDEALMADGRPALSFYNLSPSITLGPKQSYEDIDEQACKKDGLVITRRITVGTSTICGPDNMHFSIIFGRAFINEFVPRKLDGYFSSILAHAFREFDLDVEVVDFYDTREEQLPDCFMSRQPNQGILNGKKLISVAGNRSSASIVIHCVIPITNWVYGAGKYLRDGNQTPVVGTCLDDIGVTKKQARAAIEKMFFWNFGISRSMGLSHEVLLKAGRIRANKYWLQKWVKNGSDSK